MNSGFQLVLFHPEEAKLAALRRCIPGEAPVVFFRGTGVDATAQMRLDGLFVTPMMAYELGIHPPLAPHEAHVFPMPKQGLERGFPRLLIAGVSLVPGRSYPPEYLGRVTIEALGRAVASYNRRHDFPIQRVGGLPSVLGLEGSNAEAALGALDRLAGVPDEQLERRTA